MARPKKLCDADAVRLVDSLYEECGDPSRLKFSELEKHAVALNMNIKAYDLRRHEAVLRRIGEIEALVLNTDSLAVLAYKGLDVDGFINTNRTPDKLKRSLAELDERWQKLYDYAADTSKRMSALSDDLQKSKTLTDSLKSQNTELSEQIAVERRQSAALKAEVSYLRKTIQKYLYPALVDSILNSEYNASVITQASITSMIDSDVPSSFRESIANDQALRSCEDILLERLRLQAMEGDCDAP